MFVTRRIAALHTAHSVPAWLYFQKLFLTPMQYNGMSRGENVGCSVDTLTLVQVYMILPHNLGPIRRQRP
jgi:hypothetical protein